MRFGFLFAILLFLPIAARTADIEYDLGVRAEDIVIVPEKLIAGQHGRIYATVHNFAVHDGIGLVSFFQGPIMIGDPQPISAKSKGFADEVFVDFTIPDGSFNILVKLQDIKPLDQNPANDEAITPLMQPLFDRDRDVIPDIEDNCPEVANQDQADNDQDKIGDVCDPDDDNDGLADIDETSRGTNSRNPDSDGDGIGDLKDPRPLSRDVSPLAIVESGIRNQESGAAKNGVADESLRVKNEPKIEIRPGADFGPLIHNDNVSPPLLQQDKPRIPRPDFYKLYIAAGISALAAGVFSFLALRMKTPKE